MIDVDMLEVAIRHGVKIGRREVIIKSDIAIELITRLREAENDAARYRWLRDVGQHEYYVDDILACTLRGADGCIDEYMKERGDE